jgi:glycosyltransferase involved in cell wall biosynthesis
MKILVWQWGRRGAGPRFGACLADALRGRPGIEVVLSLCRDAEIMRGAIPPRCEMPVRTYRGMPGFLLRLATAPLALGPLMWRLRAIRPDLAICAMPGPLDTLMAVALRLMGTRVVVVAHEAEAHPGDGFPGQMRLQRLLCRTANGVAYLCTHVGTQLRRQGFPRLIPFGHPPFGFGVPETEGDSPDQRPVSGDRRHEGLNRPDFTTETTERHGGSLRIFAPAGSVAQASPAYTGRSESDRNDTRSVSPPLRVASATKQSPGSFPWIAGLLRRCAPRNDWGYADPAPAPRALGSSPAHRSPWTSAVLRVRREKSAFAPPPDAGERVHPGTHPAETTQRSPRLLCFGRLLPYKGLDLLAAALSQVQGIDVRIAGNGPESAALNALRAIPGVAVENRWVAEDEIAPLLAWCDAVVLPYREASQSGVAAIALAAGKPVIATSAGGLREQLARVPNAILCEPDAASLADALRQWIATRPPCLPPLDATQAWRDAVSDFLGAIQSAFPPPSPIPAVRAVAQARLRSPPSPSAR